MAATSAASAWAVGSTRSGNTLILRWNGTRWKQVPSPNPAHGAQLFGVAAAGPRAWAVGQASANYTLILRWNGTAWKRVRSPNRALGGDFFFAVTATSARNAWATGAVGTCCANPQTLIVRWNGTSWK